MIIGLGYDSVSCRLAHTRGAIPRGRLRFQIDDHLLRLVDRSVLDRPVIGLFEVPRILAS